VFSIHFSERDAREVTDRALDVWTRLAGRPRFLWVHYFDAHAPYAAPQPWGPAHAANPYDGELAYVDAEVGRLLERIERDVREDLRPDIPKQIPERQERRQPDAKRRKNRST